MNYRKVCPERCCKKGDIQIADMGHGEAIVFKKQGLLWLRDFGESSGTRKTGCSVAKILGQAACGPKCPLHSGCFFKKIGQDGLKWNAVLSHPHEDHFVGFHRLYELYGGKKKIFETAYLSRLCSSPDQMHSLSKKIEECLIIHCFTQPRGGRSSISNAFNFLVSEIVMSALSQQVVHLSATAKPERGFPGNVLFPINDIITDENVMGENRLERLVDDFWEHLPDTKSSFKSAADEISEILMKYCLSDHDATGDEAGDYNQICQQLAKLKQDAQLHFSEGNNLSRLRNTTKVNIDDSSLIFTMELDPDLSEANYPDCCNCTAAPPCHLCEKSKKCDVPTCLFGNLYRSDKNEKNTRRWLFLGDNNDPIIRSLYTVPRLHGEFHFIKAAHHGSRGGNVLKKMGVKSNCVIFCYGDGCKCNDPEISYLEIANCVIFTSLKTSHPKNTRNSIFDAANADKIKLFQGERMVKIMDKN